MNSNLLFISPVMPAPTGNGLAMRAGIMLEALAADYDVHLLVIPVVGAPPGKGADRWASRWCARLAVHRVADRVDPLYRLVARIKDPRERLAAHALLPRPLMCRFATTRAVRESAQLFEGVAFREVHVFRLYMAPFAEPYLEGGAGVGPTCRLDLDDDESSTRRSLAALHDGAGDEASAAIERSEADKYALLERQYLGRFDRVYVCSEEDRRTLARRERCRHVAVVPNAVRIPVSTTGRPRAAPFTFLFVGTFGYYPNEDAALFFCSEVLPRLRAAAGQGFRVLIVGTNPSPRVRALARHAEVTVTGAVPDLGASYRAAGAVVVPLRAGGGTRIKVLEAFSYRRPVVSTSIGAEGIDARHGTQLLIGDTPRAFAEQCVRLIQGPRLRQELATRAFRFVKAHHTPARIRELLRRDHRRP